MELLTFSTCGAFSCALDQRGNHLRDRNVHGIYLCSPTAGKILCVRKKGKLLVNSKSVGITCMLRHRWNCVHARTSRHHLRSVRTVNLLSCPNSGGFTCLDAYYFVQLGVTTFGFVYRIHNLAKALIRRNHVAHVIRFVWCYHRDNRVTRSRKIYKTSI